MLPAVKGESAFETGDGRTESGLTMGTVIVGTCLSDGTLGEGSAVRREVGSGSGRGDSADVESSVGPFIVAGVGGIVE